MNEEEKNSPKKTQQASQQIARLIHYLGGPDHLRPYLNTFYQRMQQDPMISFFFEGKDIDAIIQNQEALLLKVGGYAKEYRGSPPGQAHIQLPKIRIGQFERRLKILDETLEDMGVEKEYRDIWVNFEDSFRNVIVD